MYKSNFIAIVSIVAAASLFVGMMAPAFAQDNVTMMNDNTTGMSNMSNMTMPDGNSTMMNDNMNMSAGNITSVGNGSALNAPIPIDNSTMESMANGTVGQ
jgi:hypothetical protein